MDKPAFERRCPDCNRLYRIDASYPDLVYQAHRENDPNCVCPSCFEEFGGVTIEEFLSLFGRSRANGH